jgi:hypothetical protein
MMVRFSRVGLAASVAALAGVLVWVPSALATGPSLTVTPGTAPPTSLLHVSGSGFAATEAVDVYFDTTDLVLATTNGAGAFTNVPLTVPASASPGTHWITAVGRNDGVAVQKKLRVHTSWLERGYSAFGRSLNPFENAVSPGNVASLDEDWAASAAYGIRFGGPAVTTSSLVVYGSEDGVVRAVRQATGALVWSYGQGSR